jgi:hypothetical protein
MRAAGPGARGESKRRWRSNAGRESEDEIIAWKVTSFTSPDGLRAGRHECGGADLQSMPLSLAIASV